MDIREQLQKRDAIFAEIKQYLGHPLYYSIIDCLDDNWAQSGGGVIEYDFAEDEFQYNFSLRQEPTVEKDNYILFTGTDCYGDPHVYLFDKRKEINPKD